MYEHKHLIQTISAVMMLALGVSLSFAENIDPNNDRSQYAYGENVGWLNFEPGGNGSSYAVTVQDTKLTGYVWAENIGWINLSPIAYGGVFNDGTGLLSGYGWGENVGWINFDPNVPGDANHFGVTIDHQGNFAGWAWGENIGWIHFQSTTPVPYKVQTSWITYPACWDFLTQCHGDADGDGWVKGFDFLAVKSSWFKCYPDLAYNPCADFDRDGCVKGSDFLILKSNWYEAVDPNCPQGDINGIYW